MALKAADVEAWLNDNVDWLRDYIRRHQSALQPGDTRSRHTVPTTLCRRRGESIPWHSLGTGTVDVTLPASSSVTSSLRHQQRVRDDVTAARVSVDAAPSAAEPGDVHTASAAAAASSRHHPHPRHHHHHSVRRQLFAKSRLRPGHNQLVTSTTTSATSGALSDNTSSASFDWFVLPHSHTHAHTHTHTP